MTTESSDAAATATHAPDGWRCEGCGYPIGGMLLAAGCPECGERVGDSDPARRDGPPWERRFGAAAWAATLMGLLTRPAATYRRLTFDGSATAARVFLLGC
ncbi:MAG: hypothetical protein AAF078_05330, partial [Planctomycetota bacterium]